MFGALFFWLIVLVVLIWLYWISADVFYEIAKDKGYDDRKYWRFCFWVPPIGIAMVIAMPNKKASITTSVDYVDYNDLPEL